MGVGHNEDAFATMGRAHRGSGNNRPVRVIPERGKVSKHASEPERNEAWDVLHDRVSWSYVANESLELRPKPPFILLPFPLPREADWLAREPAEQHVRAFTVRSRHVMHVTDSPHVRPVARKHLLTELVALHLQDRLPAGALEPKVKTADPRKQADAFHSATTFGLNSRPFASRSRASASEINSGQSRPPTVTQCVSPHAIPSASWLTHVL